MSNSQALKTRGAGSKPPSSSSTASRSTLCSGTGLISPHSPGDPVSPLSALKNIRKAKALLFKLGYLLSKTETSTAAICSGLLTSIVAHPEATPNVCALITSVSTILPEAFGLLYASTKELSTISDKIDLLLLRTNKPSPAPPQGLANLEEKLDQVAQSIQKATRTWQTVPSCSRARTAPPSSPPPGSIPTAPAGPTRAELSRNRRLLSQGCFILVEPTPPGSLDNLSAQVLVQKAKFAWNSAWDKVKDTD